MTIELAPAFPALLTHAVAADEAPAAGTVSPLLGGADPVPGIVILQIRTNIVLPNLSTVEVALAVRLAGPPVLVVPGGAVRPGPGAVAYIGSAGPGPLVLYRRHETVFLLRVNAAQ